MSTRFIMFCWPGVFFCCMPWSFSDKRWLLTCMQHTRRLTHVQHMKHYSRASYYHAAHELLLACSAPKIAHVQYVKVDLNAAHFVSHVCFDLSHDKNRRTHACLPHASVKLDMSCTVAILVNTAPVIRKNYMWKSCQTSLIFIIRNWTVSHC